MSRSRHCHQCTPRLIDRSLLAATPAPRPLPPALHGAWPAWVEAPLRPSRVLLFLIPPRLMLGRQVKGVVPQAPPKHDSAGGIKHRRRVRRHTQRSMWREIQCQAPARCAMWACCADSSSDDGDHNTSNTLLLLFADAFVAPALLAQLSEVDELMVALSCRFVLDIFTIAQQDRPRPEPDLLTHDPGCDLRF